MHQDIVQVLFRLVCIERNLGLAEHGIQAFLHDLKADAGVAGLDAFADDAVRGRGLAQIGSYTHRSQNRPTSHNGPGAVALAYLTRIGFDGCSMCTRAHLYAGARYIVIGHSMTRCSRQPTPSE